MSVTDEVKPKSGLIAYQGKSTEGGGWSDDEIATLRRMVDAGESFSVIGKALGRSRNAALGKAHRLGIARGKSYCAPKPKPPTLPKQIKASPPKPAPRAPLPAPIPRAKAPALVPEVESAPPREDAWRPLPGSDPVSLFDLDARRTQCRWPVDTDKGRMFCGRPVDASSESYCCAHAHLSRRAA